ncbi:MAG: hypothetical protein HWE07_02580 [Cytophagia bacterium]|nr:hypothetical protein [Cytophagia bacterium]
MKNIRFLFSILLISIISFSCSDSESDSDTSPDLTTSLIGKWEVLIVRLYENGSLSETYTFSNDVFMDFKSDGKLIFTQESENSEETLTWERLSPTRLLIESVEYEITIRSKNEVNLKQISGFPFDQYEYEIKRK